MSRIFLFLLAAFAFAGCKPKTEYPLNIVEPVLGDEMHLTGVKYKAERNDTLQIDGFWKSDFPLNRYQVRATIGETLDGPASGGMYWYIGLPKSNQVPGKEFVLEFQSPPAASGKIFGLLSFCDVSQNNKVVRQVRFQIPNPARQPAKGLIASPIPLSSTDSGVTLTLEGLNTGRNSAPSDHAPQWFTEATYRISEDGKPSDRWQAMALRVTPNRGMPFRSALGINPPRGGVLKVPIHGTLWPDVGPFQLDLTLFQTRDVPETECYISGNIVVPKSGEVAHIERDWNAGDVNVHFDGLYGPEAPLPKGLPFDKSTMNTLVFKITGSQDVWIKIAITSGQYPWVDQYEFRRNAGQTWPAGIAIPNLKSGETMAFKAIPIREKRMFSFTVQAADH